MNDKRVPLIIDETKHKKKSKGKGLPRSKHKHIYEPVLLTRKYHHTQYPTGNHKVSLCSSVAEVCTICGRIGKNILDESYYEHIPNYLFPFRITRESLSEKAKKLPKWYAEDFWDKFAYKEEEEN